MTNVASNSTDRKHANERAYDATEVPDSSKAYFDAQTHMGRARALNMVLSQLGDTELDVTEDIKWVHSAIDSELRAAEACQARMFRGDKDTTGKDKDTVKEAASGHLWSVVTVLGCVTNDLARLQGIINDGSMDDPSEKVEATNILARIAGDAGGMLDGLTKWAEKLDGAR